MPVVLPDDPFDLIADGRSFAYDGWQDTLCASKCFRVGGVHELTTAVGVARTAIKHDGLFAKRLDIPQSWRDEYRPDNGNPWGKLGQPALRDMIGSELQVFDRALLSVLYLVRYLERSGFAITQDQVSLLKVYPVLFSLDRATQAYFNDHIQGTTTLEALTTAGIGNGPQLVQDVFLTQKCVTQANALRIAAIVNGQLIVRRGARPTCATHEEESLPTPYAKLEHTAEVTNS